MTHRGLPVAVLTLSAALGILTGQESSTTVWSPAIERLPLPAGPNSGQPQLSRSANGLLLSWIEEDGRKATLRFSERTAAGWSAPRDVASGGDWFVNWADAPPVLRLANGSWLRTGFRRADRIPTPATFVSRIHETMGRHGLNRLFRIRMARRPSTGLPRCSRCLVADWGWRGWTAAR
jgi:hypothetical protein